MDATTVTATAEDVRKEKYFINSAGTLEEGAMANDFLVPLIPVDSTSTSTDFTASVGKVITAVYTGKYYRLASTITTIDIYNPSDEASMYACAYYKCDAGEKFYVSGVGGSGARTWAFLSSANGENNILQRAASAASQVAMVSEIVTAPSGAEYAIFQWNSDYIHSVVTGDITTLQEGLCFCIYNNVVTSASGCTLNINGLGAKPIYTSTGTRVTTEFENGNIVTLVYSTLFDQNGCYVIVE